MKENQSEKCISLHSSTCGSNTGRIGSEWLRFENQFKNMYKQTYKSKSVKKNGPDHWRVAKIVGATVPEYPLLRGQAYVVRGLPGRRVPTFKDVSDPNARPQTLLYHRLLSIQFIVRVIPPQLGFHYQHL